MHLRLALHSDVAACARLDAGYKTEHTWQLSEERPPAGSAHELTVRLRCIGLPRPRSVVPPDPTPELEEEWRSADLWLVAADEDAPQGYLCLSVRGPDGWITRLVVDQPYRRTGIASSLLAAARTWALENGLRCLMAACPMKNHPAVSLFRARGYRICGYNELHFPDGEIALYLARELKSA